MDLEKTFHNFWNKTLFDDKNIKNGNIPIKLPGKLEWTDLDLNNSITMSKTIDFLNENYHDDNCKVSFVFTKELLKWLLLFNPLNLKLAVGVIFNNKLVGCIFGIIRTLNLNGKIIKGSETNLLCLTKTIRNLNISPILIKELTRRNMYYLNINQSIYTTDLTLPNIVSSVNYLYRYINIRKMIDTDFLQKSIETELGYDKIKDYYHFTKKIKGTVKMIDTLSEKELIICCDLLNNKLKSLKLSYLFDIEYFKYTFINPVMKCWVIFNKGKITDMISCYFQKTFSKKFNMYFNNCNLYYYFNNKNNIEKLSSIIIKDCINNNIDMIKVLNLMDYNNLKDFNFDQDTVTLNYYIYNWSSSNVNSKKIGYMVV